MRRMLTVFCFLTTGMLFDRLPAALAPDRDAPRPIAALDSVLVEELTWMEVRDALKAGKTTVIVPTGGVEQNGPYLATGKHNYVLRATDRGHRSPARQRPGRPHRRLRAGGRHRPADEPHEVIQGPSA